MQHSHEALTDPTPDILDADALRRNFDGDLAFMARLLGKFELAYPKQFEVIRAAIASGDSAAAAEEAHRVAGATSVFFSKSARETALQLEDLARAGDLAAAATACATLDAELKRLAGALHAMADA